MIGVAGLARTTAILVVMADALLAHDGPHMARVITDVITARQEGRELFLTLRVEAIDGAVRLQSMWAESADLVTLPDLVFEDGTPRTIDAMLRFDAPIPELFTLTLDFGDGGLGPVLVIPE